MKKLALLLGISAILQMSVGQTTESLLTTTNSFLSTLTEPQRDSIQSPFDDPKRTQWTNLPVGMQARSGMRYGNLSAESKIAFHHILTTLFSSQGYLKTTSIMALDDILNAMYKEAFEKDMISSKTYKNIQALDWDYGNYFVAIWGKPNSKEPWGLKLEGHHISINMSAVGEQFSMTPLFLGADPAEVPTSRHAGLRVLSKEEDYGLELINSLSEAQQAVATLSQKVPEDIITNPNSPQRITSYQGIKAADMNDSQKAILRRLIEEYIGNLEHEKAHAYRHIIEAGGIDEIYFAWIGSYEARKPNYYIINGPDFLIEYDNVGFNKDGNHIHSIWREKGNDFGADILKTHYLEHKH